ncbi:MAG: hypothetical protein WKF91_16190 [Segetibacter sp.]
MKEHDVVNIDNDTIKKVGLCLSENRLNTETAIESRVFEYPHLENVFIMESDLYGNAMPKGSCFLAFKGHHGLIGKHLSVERLKNASAEDIENMVQHNNEG